MTNIQIMLATVPPIVWILLLLVSLTAGSLMALGRFYEKKTGERLKNLRSELRRIQSFCQNLVEGAQTYRAGDPEPYRTPAAQFHELFSKLRYDIREIERSYVHLNEHITRLIHHPLQKTLASPASWPPIDKEIRSLKNRLDKANRYAGDVQSLFQQIQELPWETALQIRRLNDSIHSIISQLEALSRNGLYGDTFEAAVQVSQELQAAIESLPSEFKNSSRDELLQKATKATTIRTFEVLQENIPKAEQLSGKAAQWESQQALAASHLETMKGNIHNLEVILSQSHPNLDMSAERASWQKMKEIAQSLLDTANRLEVESIPLFCQEAGKLLSATQDLFIEINHAQREHTALIGLLNENIVETDSLSKSVGTLAGTSIFPIHWEGGEKKLASFSNEIQSLGDMGTHRSPAQVSTQLSAASRIRNELIEIKRQYRQIEQERTRLTAILDDPAMEKIPGLVQEARTLISETAKYSTDNWTDGENPAALGETIEQISFEHSRLVSSDRSSSISEVELAEKFKNSTQLLEKSRVVESLLNSLHQRWNVLKSAEAQAKDQIETQARSLVQLQLIARSNPFLDRTASKEIDQLQNTVQKLKQHFAQPEHGRLEARILETASLQTHLDGQIRGWLAHLTSELSNLRGDLTKSLNALNEIGVLEDPPIDQARRLLNSLADGRTRLPEGRKTAGLEDAILEIKESSDAWQECQAAQKGLESLQQLRDTYQQAGSLREETLEATGSLPEWGSRKRSWPPVSRDLKSERMELNDLEREWKAKRNQPSRAIGLVAHFSSLASRYQALSTRLKQFDEQRDEDHETIADLERQIAQAAGEWENLLRLYSDNPSACQEIQDFLNALDHNLEMIETGYLQSELEFDQVLQQMNSILRRIRFFQVALDDEHALDASGRIIRRIQTERE